jgi:hypothetical protein
MTQRPRDRLGRPATPGSPDVVPGVPEREQVDTDTAWHEALAYLDCGLPFHAHEVLEQRWRCCPAEERQLWRGLAQWGAALTHRARGNAVGAGSVAARARRTLDLVAAVPPVDLAIVRASLDELTAAG